MVSRYGTRPTESSVGTVGTLGSFWYKFLHLSAGCNAPAVACLYPWKFGGFDSYLSGIVTQLQNPPWKEVNFLEPSKFQASYTLKVLIFCCHWMGPGNSSLARAEVLQDFTIKFSMRLKHQQACSFTLWKQSKSTSNPHLQRVGIFVYECLWCFCAGKSWQVYTSLFVWQKALAACDTELFVMSRCSLLRLWSLSGVERQKGTFQPSQPFSFVDFSGLYTFTPENSSRDFRSKLELQPLQICHQEPGIFLWTLWVGSLGSMFHPQR